MPKTSKVSNHEKRGRVEKIMELMANGLPRREILQYVAEKTEWNVSTRTIDAYIAEANDAFALEAGYSRDREAGKAKRTLENILKACMRVQDYGRAITAQRELNTLMALYAAPAVKTVRIEGIDDAQLKVLADALAAHGKRASDVFNAIMQVIAEDAQ